MAVDPCRTDRQVGTLSPTSVEQDKGIETRDDQELRSQGVDGDGALLASEGTQVLRRIHRTTAGHHSNPYHLPCTTVRLVEGEEGSGVSCTVGSLVAVFRPWT